MAIIVNMACGLANRMFQYSYYLYLKKLGYDVWVDYYRTAKLAHEDVAWNRIFPKADIEQVSQWKVFLLGGSSGLCSKIRRRYLPFTTRVIYMPTAFTVSLPDKNSKDSYLFGVFQNVRMVDAIKDEVLQAFSFSPFTDERNRILMEEMQSSESVAIHVRKGMDYQSRIWYQNTCPVTYYRQAIDRIKQEINHPKFYVFADNHEWVKEHFKDFEYTLIDGNPTSGWGAHFDMQLMSCCKHAIVSNSTYGWWGAYLNDSQNRMVILPKVWFNPQSCKDYTSAKLLCKGWISL